MLRCEAEQSLEQGQGFSNSNPSTQPKREQGEPDLAGSHASQAHGATQGGWVQDQAPQPWRQAETHERTTYRRTICTRHARKTGLAQRPLKTNKNNSCSGQSLHSIRGRVFSDTFLAFSSCESLQRGKSVGKADVTCRSLLISAGRVDPASQDAAASVPAPHTDII